MTEIQNGPSQMPPNSTVRLFFVFVRISREILCGVCLLSGFGLDFLSSLFLSGFRPSRFYLLPRFEKTLSVVYMCGQGQDTAVRTVGVLVDRSSARADSISTGLRICIGQFQIELTDSRLSRKFLNMSHIV